MPAYVAPGRRRRSGRRSIVLQEIFGVNDKVRAIADLVAAAGFLAVAPAVYHRADPHFEVDVDPEGLRRGREHAARVTPEGFAQDVAGVLGVAAHATGLEPEDGLTWGFCFGGALAYLSATCPGIDAACVFYGRQITQGPQFIRFTSEIAAPLFLCFGGRDQGIPAGDVATIERPCENTANGSSSSSIPMKTTVLPPQRRSGRDPGGARRVAESPGFLRPRVGFRDPGVAAAGRMLRAPG